MMNRMIPKAAMMITETAKHELRPSRSLLKKAVHRSRTLSTDGLLERLFTVLFSGLVYPQIWEDPEVDLAAMEIERGHHIVAIASGGCNILSYLLAEPARIAAVDLNRAHVALCRLKLAGLNALPSWEDYYRFFGAADEVGNARIYRALLRPHLDAETRRYWDGRTPLGRRRITCFERNIYTNGLLGRLIGAGHALAGLYGKDVTEILRSRSLSEQRRFFETEIAPLFDKRLVRWITESPVSLFGLGIPPSQYKELAGDRCMSDVLRGRLERLACGFPLHENYFAWQAFGRAYAPGACGPLPPYLNRNHFAQLRAASGRVSIEQISITESLRRMPACSVDRVVLLDAQDWMTNAQLNELWSAITCAAAPAARVIFRTAGTETLLPGRVDAGVLASWMYLAERSRELAARDRSSIYGGFHIYELLRLN